MTARFYLRWSAILMAAAVIGFLGAKRYDREVRTLTPAQVLAAPTPGPVRLLGRVEAGSLVKTTPFTAAEFTLADGEDRIRVSYQGEEPDNLRELKTLVVVGRWDSLEQRFFSTEIDLVPNFGYIIGAYLTLFPLALFLFLMERRVLLLYTEIKQSKVYEAEAKALDEG